MSKMQVFDPPMCCSTGVCGPSVDPTLARFASDLEWLKANGIEVERFNLSHDVASFLENPVVAKAMGENAALPYLLVDGKLAARGAYPTREALAALVELEVPRGANVESEKAPAACRAPSGGAPVALDPKKCC